jgi:hypothetical protein
MWITASTRMRIFLEERGKAEHLFPLSLLAREALNNAMIHGNRRAPDKTVRFQLVAREHGFDMEVEDEGQGFEWKSRVQASSHVDDERGEAMKSTAITPTRPATTRRETR